MLWRREVRILCISSEQSAAEAQKTDGTSWAVLRMPIPPDCPHWKRRLHPGWLRFHGHIDDAAEDGVKQIIKHLKLRRLKACGSMKDIRDGKEMPEKEQHILIETA